jgi:hypothetical protein
VTPPEQETYLPGEPQKVKCLVKKWHSQPPEPMTFHFFPRGKRKLKRGDLVVVEDGVFAGQEVVVCRARSRWKGYTYSVKRALSRHALQKRLNIARIRLDECERRLKAAHEEVDLLKQKAKRKKK